jgi:hypothetical protein
VPHHVEPGGGGRLDANQPAEAIHEVPGDGDGARGFLLGLGMVRGAAALALLRLCCRAGLADGEPISVQVQGVRARAIALSQRPAPQRHCVTIHHHQRCILAAVFRSLVRVLRAEKANAARDKVRIRQRQVKARIAILR